MRGSILGGGSLIGVSVGAVVWGLRFGGRGMVFRGNG